MSSGADIGLFDAIYTNRAIRRFRAEPVPDELVLEVIEAGTMAPSRANSQPWAFVAVRDRETKRFIHERYREAFRAAYDLAERYIASAPSGDRQRVLASAADLAEHLADVPVLLFCCVERSRIGRGGEASLAYDSILPAVQNILLACRGLGLGACLTTLHTVAEREIATRLGIPPDYACPVMIPIGFPRDRFGPVRRRSAGEVTHWEKW